MHLTIPVDVFTGMWVGTALRTGGPGTAPPCPDLKQATELLRAAKRPVVIAGSGVWWSGAEEALREFIERTQIPLYTITMARGTVPDDHPLSMGYADPALNYAVHTVFREADLFLVVGKRIDYRLALGGARLFPAEAKFIQIDIHPQELGMNRALDAAVCGDARAALDAIPDAGRADGVARTGARVARGMGGTAGSGAGGCGGVLPGTARGAAPGRAFLLGRRGFRALGAGDSAGAARGRMAAAGSAGHHRVVAAQRDRAATGAPGEAVVAITGDGALGFYLAEMDTAARFKLPIVLIVGNDAGWGLERELQSWGTGGAPTVACELQAARYDLVMKAFGGDGETIERPEEDRRSRSGRSRGRSVSEWTAGVYRRGRQTRDE